MTILKARHKHSMVSAYQSGRGDAAGGGGSVGHSWGDGKGQWEEQAEVMASCKSCSSPAAVSRPNSYLWISLVNTSGWWRRFQDKMVPYTEISWFCGLVFLSIGSLPECWTVLSMMVLHSVLFFTLLYLVELLWSNIPLGWHTFVIYLFMFVHCRNYICKWQRK